MDSTMNLSLEFIAALLLIAAIVAMTARRLKIPYTVGLMLTGIVLAISPFPTDDVEITKDLIFTIFLPPLIYEAAIYIKWQELRRDLPVILTLATVGVLLSAGVTALGMHYLGNRVSRRDQRSRCAWAFAFACGSRESVQ